MGSSHRNRVAVDPLRGWLDSFVSEIDQLSGRPSPLAVVKAVVAVGAAGFDVVIVDDDENADLTSVVDRVDVPPGGWANPWLPGLVHERVVSLVDRKVRGAWYTPRSLVEGLVAFVGDCVDLPDFAVDPTCGGGAFLLAVLDRWVDCGVDPKHAVVRVAGTDIDPDAVQVCRWSLQLWAAGHGVDIEAESLDVSNADALVAAIPTAWPDRRLVIGNPPFASPLKKGAIPESAQRYRELHSHDLGQYADLAALHLHRCVDRVGDGSVVSLVLPQSVVSSRDVAPFRRRIENEAATIGMWAAREAVFDAGVRTCAPVLVPGRDQPSTVHLASGPTAAPVGTTKPGRWSAYAARCLGGPPLPTSVTQPAVSLSSLCSATAGFRDEYYGLVSACREWESDAEPPNRLITVGSVDPLVTSWGEDPIRFGGRRWAAPVIATDELNDKVRRWTKRQMKPKVVVATQSKLLEPVIDIAGRMIPSTPLLAVHTDLDDLGAVAAVCLAPPVVAAAWERWFGSALAVDALKLAASQLGELPLPPDRRIWQKASALITDHATSVAPGDADHARSLAAEVAALMNEAYRADSAVLKWWLERAGG